MFYPTGCVAKVITTHHMLVEVCETGVLYKLIIHSSKHGIYDSFVIPICSSYFENNIVSTCEKSNLVVYISDVNGFKVAC